MSLSAVCTCAPPSYVLLCPPRFPLHSKTTSQSTYLDHGFQAVRPRKQPDRTNLRVEGSTDMQTEMRRQFTSPW